jgi:hypothetical protein
MTIRLIHAMSNTDIEYYSQKFAQSWGRKPHHDTPWEEWRAVLTMPPMLEFVEKAAKLAHPDRVEMIDTAISETVQLLVAACIKIGKPVGDSPYTIAWTAQMYRANIHPALIRLDRLINELETVQSEVT